MQLLHLLAVLLLLLTALFVDDASPQLRAPAVTAFADCNCQCKGLGFVDKRGRRHGNCLSAFHGKKWCYVDDPRHSPCPDLTDSKRYAGQRWSSHACFTPPRIDPRCANYFLQPRGQGKK